MTGHILQIVAGQGLVPIDQRLIEIKTEQKFWSLFFNKLLNMLTIGKLIVLNLVEDHTNVKQKSSDTEKANGKKVDISGLQVEFPLEKKNGRCKQLQNAQVEEDTWGISKVFKNLVFV